MADIRTSSMQKPSERVQSIKTVNKLIAESKDVRDWNLEISLVPDEIEAKVL
jgi:hypothetical protein